MKMAWVQIDPDTQLAVRIFKNRKSMVFEFGEAVSNFISFKHTDRGLAVSQIRRQVWNRQEGLCARCPEIVTWLNSHLHEIKPKGDGGEVSLNNCEILCAACHIGPMGVHGNRLPKFSSHNEQEEPK